MMRPESMSKVLIAAPLSQMPTVVDMLYELKLLHVAQHVKSSSVDIASPLPWHESVSKYLIHLSTVLSRIDQGSITESKPADFTLDALSGKLDTILPEINSTYKKKDYCRRVQNTLSTGRHLHVAENIPLDYKPGKSYHGRACFAGFIRISVLDTLNERFKDIEAFTADVDGHHAILVYGKDEDQEGLRKALDEVDFIPFDNLTLKNALPALRGKLLNKPADKPAIETSVSQDLKTAEASLKELFSKHGTFLTQAHCWLGMEGRKAELPLKFGTTEKAFFIQGWVPTEDEQTLIKGLEKATDNSIHIEAKRVTPREAAPVKQNIPKLFRPFKHFLDMFASPLYGEVDPTMLIALTFPLFFGFMLGDIGYGLVVLAVAILAYKATKGKPIVGVLPPVALGYAALCTIFFGAVFAEFFGAEIGLYSPLFARVHLSFIGTGAEHSLLHIADGKNILIGGVNADALLAISIFIGFIHLTLGFLTGFSNVWRMHGFKHAIMKKFGWLLIMPGMLLLVLEMGLLSGGYGTFAAGLLPSSTIVWILSIAGLALVLKGDGMIGLIELPTLLSNILSYARLMAVGLASVLLAIVANQLASQSFSGGNILGWIGGIIILVLFHVINVLLGILSPFLHSLRLHYVEYFTKFYQGGGKEYSPFGVEM